MRRTLAGVAVLAALIAAPGAASAADQTVQAVDGTEADNYNNRWQPPGVTVAVGETVTWSFAGTTGVHNIASTGSNWSYRNGDPTIAPPNASHSFATPGVYTFVCEIHATTMVGAVTVTDPTGAPPPPPPPPVDSELPWRNDQPAPSVFDVADEDPPVLERVRVERIAHGARVRFRVSEAGRVAIRVKRGGRAVKTRRIRARKGTRTVKVRGLRDGRYRVEVCAWDLARNRSRTSRARVTVRS